MYNFIKRWFNRISAPKKPVLTEELKAVLREKARIGANKMLAEKVYGVPIRYFETEHYFADAIVNEIDLDKCFASIKEFPDIASGTKAVFLQAVAKYLMDSNTLEVVHMTTGCLICERLAERLLDANFMILTSEETFQLTG